VRHCLITQCFAAAATCKTTTLNNDDASSDEPQSSAAAVQSNAQAFRSNVTFLGSLRPGAESKNVTLDLKACAFDCTATADGPYSPEGRDPLQSSKRLAVLNVCSEGKITIPAAKQI